MWNLQLLVAVRTLRVWYKLTQLLKYIIYAIFFVRECHHCISNCSHRCLTQPFATQQLSTHFSISLEKNVCFCSFEPKIKKQCWSLEAVCGRLVNISKSTAMLLEPKCDQVALWRCCGGAGLQQRHHVLSVRVAFGRQRHQLVRLREDDHRVRGACGRWRTRPDEAPSLAARPLPLELCKT